MTDFHPLPKLKLRGEVLQALQARAKAKGYRLDYYILYLIGKDLGYVKRGVSEKQVREWLREAKPVRARQLSAAGRALQLLGPGIHPCTKVAEGSGLSYQQAYRQMLRDPAVRKTDGGWELISAPAHEA